MRQATHRKKNSEPTLHFAVRQLGHKFPQLVDPVLAHCKRDHNEVRPTQLSLRLEISQERQSLERLAEAHLITQHAWGAGNKARWVECVHPLSSWRATLTAKAVVEVVDDPVDPYLLVVAELCTQKKRQNKKVRVDRARLAHASRWTCGGRQKARLGPARNPDQGRLFGYKRRGKQRGKNAYPPMKSGISSSSSASSSSDLLFSSLDCALALSASDKSW